MTREKFIDFTKDHIIYLDGATGSNLVKAGMPSGVCPEQWILEHREVMLQLQKEYVQAGTNILYAPTFTANRVKLAEYHLEKNMSSMIHDLVAVSYTHLDVYKRQQLYQFRAGIALCHGFYEDEDHSPGDG